MLNPREPMLSELIVSIQNLFREAETNNLSEVQFAVKIWMGTMHGVIPEKTLVSILFEKAAQVTPEESYRMIYDLAFDSLLGKEEAIRSAFQLIITGLEIINQESIMRKVRDSN
ncbi:hypothetical protein [Microcoleus asticus]